MTHPAGGPQGVGSSVGDGVLVGVAVTVSVATSVFDAVAEAIEVGEEASVMRAVAVAGGKVGDRATAGSDAPLAPALGNEGPEVTGVAGVAVAVASSGGTTAAPEGASSSESE